MTTRLPDSPRRRAARPACRGDGASPHGMSLIEAVVATAIVGLMLTAALTAMGSFARAGQMQTGRCLGEHLARQLLEETLQAYYLEPDGVPTFGPEALEASASRAAWDDVDDYHGLVESPPRAKDGTPLVGAEGWTRRATVQYVQATDPSLTSGTDQGLKRITVTAEGPDRKKTTLQALRSRLGACDLGPQAHRKCVTWVGVEVQIGPSQAARVRSGAAVLNAAAVVE